MVDGVLTAQAQNASGVGRSDRAGARGPVQPVRGVSATGQRAFGESFAEAAGALYPPSNDQPTVGGGLLSTGVQVMLAETRSQEAAAPFAPPSNIGRAINVYLETQTQVRDTIRDNSFRNGGEAGQVSQQTRNNLISQAYSGGTSATGAAAEAGVALGAGSPIDSSIDGADA